ncbi:MotA/TolQ/ExbB proton channel family protein [Bacteroidales bacterium OttesenSCG-928-I21]|nr:MotA/TolQ/ExbB proton channel family protein [Bacteroidales bacterium OttesenSCG-928-I21]
METKNVSSKKGFHVSAGIVIVCCFVLAILIFNFIFGNPKNFMNNDPNNHPLPGNLLGTIYKGGVIVPIIQTLLLTVLVLSIERFIAVMRAQGKKKLVTFVENIKAALSSGNMDEAKKICDEQKGSVANVVNAGLMKYAQMEKETDLTREQKENIIQKEIEEATTLELPSLEQNLPIIATMTTLGTLMGLLGTVIGMIKSFAALANAGSPDSIALSTGISEALVNTAFGIATGALAVISYNYFTTKIDGITHAIDEVGFTMVQSFSESQSK